MSGLTAVQVQEVTALINARLGEFNVEGAFVFEPVTPGVARLVADAITEWRGEDEDRPEFVHVTSDVTAIREREFADGWKAGYERGRAAMRYELGMAEQAGGWVGTNYQAGLSDVTDPEQIRADIRDHTAYPSLDDAPNGADVFAGVHPVAGIPDSYPDGAPRARFDADDLDRQWEREGEEQSLAMEAQAIEEDRRYREAVDELVGSETVAEFLANDQPQDAAGMPKLSPDAAATLGPEHTTVTPIVPRRPRTLAEVDADEGDDVGDEPERGMGINRSQRARMEALELQQKAAAKAKLGEVTREQMIAELKRQSMAGTMPTQEQFDTAKPAVWPKAQMLTIRLNASWADLAREAGLKQVRR